MEVKMVNEKTTHDDPVQLPSDDVPLITSQYDPSGRDVVNVVDHSESALLIATKPSAPIQMRGPQLRPYGNLPWAACGRTTPERDLLRLRRHPVGQRCAANVVPESDHAGDGGPAVLTEPAVRPAASRAGASPAIGRARVGVGEAAVRGQNGGRAVWMCQREDHGGRVSVRARVGVEGGAVLQGGGLDPFGRQNWQVLRTRSVSWLVTKALAPEPATQPVNTHQ